ncbi:MAG: chemotaxis protein CheW [Betaproteobacteria bacterium]
MSAPGTANAGLAAALRKEFDQAFAVAATTRKVQNTHLLAIRVDANPYAIQVAEIGGLQVDRVIAPLPTTIGGLLGLAGIRGELVPVYSLAVLLGYHAPLRVPRWLALCGGAHAFGLAFDDFERHLNVAGAQIATADSVNTKAQHIGAVAHTEGGSRPVISIPSIAAEIARRCTTVGVSKET